MPVTKVAGVPLKGEEMKLDDDIKEMTFAERGQELARIRSLIRTHKKKRRHARCQFNDDFLYKHSLPEGSENVGYMDLPIDVLLRGCEKYIK